MRHSSHNVVIVGTGHAGAQAAISLRQQGFAGSILMIGRDSEVPYERPALSKDYLSGAKPFERMLLKPRNFWQDKQIDMLLCSTVAALDIEGRAVVLESGTSRRYDKLIWAGGGEARRLSCSGADLSGVHTIRHKADVDALRTSLSGDRCKVAIIGGGYIGLEAAAVLTKLGHAVTLFEAQSRVLSRVAGPELATFFEQEHRAKGVDIRTGVQVSHLAGDDGKVCAVILGNGEAIPADVVIVGIGIDASIAPLRAAGAAGLNGVDVDEFCRTSLSQIYAVGDCAAHINKFANGARVRLESVQNANDMAMVAARHICGQSVPYVATPWFWSNQYDLKLQSVGLSAIADQSIVRGAPEARKFTVAYLREGRVVALDCVNAVKDFVQGRRLVEQAAAPSLLRLSDPQIELSDL